MKRSLNDLREKAASKPFYQNGTETRKMIYRDISKELEKSQSSYETRREILSKARGESW